MKVCILGLSPTRAQAPMDGYELWGLAWDPECLVFDRVFEMHDERVIRSPVWERYVDRLSMCAKLYVQHPIEGAPNGIVYPFDEVAKTTGAYWCSSMAYLMALAIHEGAEEIAIYGVDMAGDEQYAYQHPNMNFLIGLAMGKGIKVTLPEGCPLLAFVSDPDYEYVQRYGRLA